MFIKILPFSASYSIQISYKDGAKIEISSSRAKG